MTLIALVKDDRTVSIVCDLVLSGTSNDEPLSWETLPFQFIKSRKGQLVKEFNPGRLVDFERKVAILGMVVVLWSGNWVCAKSILHDLDESIQHRPLKEVLQPIIEKVASQDADVEIIAAKIHNDGIEIFAPRCECREYGNVKIYAGGSGAYRFIDEYDDVSAESDIDTAFRQIMSRTAHVVISELADEDSYHYGIGGGYELAIAAKDGWKFQPHCTALFLGQPGSLECKGMVCTSYYENHLILTSFLINSFTFEMMDWGYLHLNGIEGCNILPIDDILKPRGTAMDFISRIPPEKFIDFIQNDSEVSTAILIKSDPIKGETKIDYACHTTPTMNALINFNSDGTMVDASKVFIRRDFLREIESYYHDRPFIPPKHVADQYPVKSIFWYDRLRGAPDWQNSD